MSHRRVAAAVLKITNVFVMTAYVVRAASREAARRAVQRRAISGGFRVLCARVAARLAPSSGATHNRHLP